MNSLYISIVSAIISIISAIVAFLSLSDSKRSYQLTQTPIIVPIIVKGGDKTNVTILNNHKTGIAKDLSVLFKRGKLTSDIYKSDDLLTPDSRIDIPNISESLDGCLFEIKYKNFFDQQVCIKGTVTHLPNGLFDLQNQKLVIKGLIK